MLWGMTQADVVKISDEEVEFLFGLGVEEGAKYILENFGVKLVFVTCGAEGCFFKNAKAEGMVPSLSGIPLNLEPPPIIHIPSDIISLDTSSDIAITSCTKADSSFSNNSKLGFKTSANTL